MEPVAWINKILAGSAARPIANERGAALIMAVIMLVVFSILGSVVLMSSDSELKISKNYQANKQTFWVADRAVEYATSRNMLMTMGAVESLMTGTTVITGEVKTHKELIEAAGGGVLTEGRIRDLGVGDLPATLAGAYGSDFGANYYQVSVTAQQNNNPDSTAVRIETTMVRIFKSDDESIFVTTGGG